MNTKFAIGGIVAAALVIGGGVYFLAGGKGGSGVSTADAKARADQMLAPIKEQGHAPSYQSVEGAGRGIVMKNITVKPKDGTKSVTEVKIAEVIVRDWDWQGGKFPTYGDIEYKKVTFGGLANDPDAKRFLADTGLADLVINARVAYKYDKASKTLELSTLNGEIEGMGTVGLALKVEGIDLEALQAMQGGMPDMSKLLGQVMAIRLHGATNFVKDSGGYDRIAKAAGARANITAEQWKEQQLRQLQGIKRMAPPSKISTEAFAAVEAFLKKPGTIEIKLAPKTPVVLAELAAMGQPTPDKLDALKERLGLTIVYK